MPVEFTTSATHEIRVQDTLQHRQFTLESLDPVVLDCPAGEPFAAGERGPERLIDFAVEDSRVFETSGLTIPERVNSYIRTADGSAVAQVSELDARSFPHDTYVLELNAPVKLFVRFSSAFDIIAGDTESRVLFGEGTRVFIGGRSMQNTATETYTVDTTLDSLYDVLTYLGSALVTYSPERSWPTLRGHPPHLTLAETSTVPTRTPTSGVTIQVPRDREFLYAAAPLAYYLDATVEPGAKPVLETDAGYRESLPAESALSFSRRIHELLQHQFTLDALTRTVGFYDIALFERERFERVHEPLPWRELYSASLAERVGAYQEVPRAATAAVQPTWRTTTTVEPKPEYVRTLPYVVSELSLVQPLASTGDAGTPADHADDVVSFLRGPTRGPEPTDPTDRRYVSPPETDSLEDVWIGDGIPVNATKYLHAGYAADRTRTPGGSDITIQVVCNDAEMRHEVEDELYGGREELPFEVSTAFDTSVTELRELIREETDFFHYIGHLDGEYFYCRDGRLDPASLDDVGVRGFLLNGCESYNQGVELTAAGATGGIVTLSRVADQSASRVGVMLARLLDQGFSMRGALAVARDHQVVGSQYVGIGNTSISLVQSESGTPAVAYVSRHDEDVFSVAMRTYPTNTMGMGTVYRPFLGGITQHFLTGGLTNPVRVSRAELVAFLQQDYLLPVVYEGEFSWSTEFVETLES